MPGTYPEEPGATDAATVPVEPVVRPRQTRRAPARFRDALPEPLREVIPASTTSSATQRKLPAVFLIVTDPLKIALNSFGLFRRYSFRPSHDPDAFVNPSDLSNLVTYTPPPPPPPSTSREMNREPPWPFANMSIWRLMRWMNTGGNSKSEEEINRLADDVLNASDFRAKDLHNFDVRRENSRIDSADKTTPLEDNFQVTSVAIEIPSGKPTDPKSIRTYEVPGLHYRKLLNVIKATFENPLSKHFHFTPFTLGHRSPTADNEQRVYGELYNSDEFINEYNRVQSRSPSPPDDPGCKLEKVVAALMFWSDSTHLTNFGTAALWPIYLFFGNVSKYVRSRPSSGACHHLA